MEKKNILIIILVAILVIAIGIGACIFLTSPEDVETQITNSSNATSQNHTFRIVDAFLTSVDVETQITNSSNAIYKVPHNVASDHTFKINDTTYINEYGDPEKDFVTVKTTDVGDTLNGLAILGVDVNDFIEQTAKSNIDNYNKLSVEWVHDDDVIVYEGDDDGAHFYGIIFIKDNILIQITSNNLDNLCLVYESFHIHDSDNAKVTNAASNSTSTPHSSSSNTSVVI